MNKNHNAIWVIGGGKFGQKAVHHFLSKTMDYEITLVDTSLPEILPSKVAAVIADGPSWLAENLTEKSDISAIIPAIPLHLAYEWLKIKLHRDDKVSLQPLCFPEKILKVLPNPMPTQIGQVAASHADFICPDNCREPENICTFTGKPRPQPLFDLLNGIKYFDLYSVVLISHQIYPGVGGLSPKDLWNVYCAVRNMNGKPILLSTSCKCHGIINFFSTYNTLAPLS